MFEEKAVLSEPRARKRNTIFVIVGTVLSFLCIGELVGIIILASKECSDIGKRLHIIRKNDYLIMQLILHQNLAATTEVLTTVVSTTTTFVDSDSDFNCQGLKSYFDKKRVTTYHAVNAKCEILKRELLIFPIDFWKILHWALSTR